MIPRVRLLQPRELILLLLLLSIAVLIRLLKISQPFVDSWSWRQADVAMIAENFYRQGFNIFYPQINWAGSSPGYVGTEFPLVPLIASLVYLLFGVHEWIGRLVSVLFFATSTPFFYLLVKKIFNERSALFAVCMYSLAPLSIFTSRSFTPDMPALCLAIGAIYLFAEWLDHPGNQKLLIATSFVSALAILVKLPSIIIGLPLLYMAWQRHRAKLFRRRELWVFAAASLIPPLAWYSHAYLISLHYFPFHLFGEGGLKIVGLDKYWGILHRTATFGLTPIVSAMMLVAVGLRMRGDLCHVFHWWLIASVLFVLFAGEGGRRHAAYQLPMVPVSAAFGGLTCDLGLAKLRKVIQSQLAEVFACLVLFGFIAYASYSYTRPLYEPWANPFWMAGNELNKIAPRQALVTFVDVGDPTGIYYSRRRGCHFHNPINSRDGIQMVERLRAVGVRYFALTHYDFWWLDHYRDFQTHLDSLYKRVREEEEYIIFDLMPIQRGDGTRLMKKTEASWNSGEGGSLQGKHCGCPVAGYQCLGPR